MTYTLTLSFSHASYETGHAPSPHIVPYVPVTSVPNPQPLKTPRSRVRGSAIGPFAHVAFLLWCVVSLEFKQLAYQLTKNTYMYSLVWHNFKSFQWLHEWCYAICLCKSMRTLTWANSWASWPQTIKLTYSCSTSRELIARVAGVVDSVSLGVPTDTSPSIHRSARVTTIPYLIKCHQTRIDFKFYLIWC